MRSPTIREVFFVAMVISVKCFGRWILYNSACFRPFENPRPLPDAPGDRRDTATVLPSIQDSLLGNLGGCFCVLDLGFCTRSSTPRPLGTTEASVARRRQVNRKSGFFSIGGNRKGKGEKERKERKKEKRKGRKKRKKKKRKKKEEKKATAVGHE